jgi:hypothetical protein
MIWLNRIKLKIATEMTVIKVINILMELILLKIYDRMKKYRMN